MIINNNCHCLSFSPENARSATLACITVAALSIIAGVVLAWHGHRLAPQINNYSISGLACIGVSLVTLVAAAAIQQLVPSPIKEVDPELDIPADLIEEARALALGKNGEEVANEIELIEDLQRQRAFLEVVTRDQVMEISEAGRAIVLAALLPTRSDYVLHREPLQYIWTHHNSLPDFALWVWAENREGQHQLFRKDLDSSFIIQSNNMRAHLTPVFEASCTNGANRDLCFARCLKLVKAYPKIFCKEERAEGLLFSPPFIDSVRVFCRGEPDWVSQLIRAGWTNFHEQG